MITLLEDVTSPSVGPYYVLEKESLDAVSKHTVMVETTGNPTAVVIGFEAAYPGSEKFVEVAEHIFTAEDIAAGFSMFHIVNTPALKIRARLKALQGGTAPTVSANYMGSV